MQFCLDVRTYPEEGKIAGRAYRVHENAPDVRSAMNHYLKMNPGERITRITAYRDSYEWREAFAPIDVWVSNHARRHRGMRQVQTADGEQWLSTKTVVMSPELIVIDGEQVTVEKPFEGRFGYERTARVDNSVDLQA